VKEFAERLSGLDVSEIVQTHVPEACVEEVEDGVFVASDVEVYAGVSEPVVLRVVTDEL
jgi:hypothetical protein